MTNNAINWNESARPIWITDTPPIGDLRMDTELRRLWRHEGGDRWVWARLAE